MFHSILHLQTIANAAFPKLCPAVRGLVVLWQGMDISRRTAVFKIDTP